MEPIAIYILAGGKSARMGQDKGLLQLGDKKIIEYIIDIAQTINNSIFILSNKKEYEQFSLPLIEDIYHDIGPAGGIDAMLQHTESELNLILSCDMPFVDKNSINFLISQSKNHQITVPIFNNFPETMIGVYKKSCRETWREAVKENVYKMSTMIARFDTNFVNGNDMLKNNPFLFSNINTPEDLEKAKTWIKQ
jgi:molybdopterin-guanine dinucleotide biosynthesis protein A